MGDELSLGGVLAELERAEGFAPAAATEPLLNVDALANAEPYPLESLSFAIAEVSGGDALAEMAREKMEGADGLRMSNRGVAADVQHSLSRMGGGRQLRMSHHGGVALGLGSHIHTQFPRMSRPILPIYHRHLFCGGRGSLSSQYRSGARADSGARAVGARAGSWRGGRR